MAWLDMSGISPDKTEEATPGVASSCFVIWVTQARSLSGKLGTPEDNYF